MDNLILLIPPMKLSCLMMMKIFLLNQKKTFGYSNESQREVFLLQILNSIGAPHYAFKLIMEWAHDAFISGYKFSPKCGTHQQQIKRIERWLNLSHCRPFKKQVVLPPDQLQLDVTCFPFVSMLESLLNNPELTQDCNLVINKNGDHFSKFKSPEGRLGEVNSGAWYRTAYKFMIKNVDTDFLCPIIFAMDKTTISNMA